MFFDAQVVFYDFLYGLPVQFTVSIDVQKTGWEFFKCHPTAHARSGKMFCRMDSALRSFGTSNIGRRTVRLPICRYFALILEVTDPEPYPRYRLEIRDEPTGAMVFSGELVKTGITEVSVALPRRLLAAGEYQLSLYGLHGGQEAELVEEYALFIELE